MATSTGRLIPVHKISAYYKARAQGETRGAAALRAGISKDSARVLERNPPEHWVALQQARRPPTTSAKTMARGKAGHGNPWAEHYANALGRDDAPDPLGPEEMSDDARRALDDFGFFRARYLGRGRSPWQEEAGEKILAWLLGPETEFVVLNSPPAVGKSTLAHDVVCWLICRDRRIRILLGSRTYNQAVKYSRRVRRTLTLRSPYRPTERARREDLAVDAAAVLVDDYGRFQPDRDEVWQAGGFTVAQVGDLTVADKEPTVSAFGFDADYLGMRPDVSIWDDLVDPKNVRSADQREDIRELWDSIAEPRIEPGGCLILQGQRLRHDDLYRYCLDKRKVVVSDDPDDDVEEMGPKYRHVVYPAHDEANCLGNHSRGSPALGDPDGCLLNPRRLHWGAVRTLEVEQPDVYRVVYQQEDLDPTSALVDRLWVEGGLGTDGVMYPGCWDPARSLWQVPSLAPPLHCFACVDPSVSNWWACQVWLYHPASEARYLLAIERRRMTAPEFLERTTQGSFVGMLPEYQERSVELGVPIRHWIVEVNAAQKWLLQYRHARDWATSAGVNFVPHTTGIYKTDTDRGVPSVKPLWRTGRIRLPGNPHDGSRAAADLLVKEALRWPHGVTDDQVMAHWMGEWNLARLFPRRHRDRHRQWRPSWLVQRSA